MATKSKAMMRAGVLVAFAIAVSSLRAADELTRDQLIDAMVAHTRDAGWECSGEYSGCSKLRSAFPRFFESGNELLIESLVRIDHRNSPLHRSVMLYRSQNWDQHWQQSWELHFQIEHYSGADFAFPMILRCQPTTAQHLRCLVSEGMSFAENGGGFRNYELTWYR